MSIINEVSNPPFCHKQSDKITLPLRCQSLCFYETSSFLKLEHFPTIEYREHKTITQPSFQFVCQCFLVDKGKVVFTKAQTKQKEPREIESLDSRIEILRDLQGKIDQTRQEPILGYEIQVLYKLCHIQQQGRCFHLEAIL